MVSSINRATTGSAQAAPVLRNNPTQGRVMFVGTGPGDPNLLTLAAVAALSDADCVLLDRGSLRAIFEHPAVKIPAHARIEDLSEFPTAELKARRIAEIISAGRRVVRLVEGDPFLDGGVGAEATACVNAGLKFEVIPGVSSLTSIPEYAGVRLDDSKGVQFVSALDDSSSAEQAAHWAETSTVIISTQVRRVPEFVSVLLEAGRPSDDAIIVTLRGGSREQESKETKLGLLNDVVKAFKADADEHVHIMLGRAASTAMPELDWFETKPLFGWRILVPKTKDNLDPMVTRLHSYGAHHDEVPTISVEPPRSPLQMDKAIRGLVEGRYEWVAFTSTNAVKAVREKFESYGLDARAFSGLKVAAVADGTADALQAWGIEPDLVPTGDATTVGLASVFPAYDHSLDPINRVFLPRADIATETLAGALTELGWEVEDVTAYRTVRASPPPATTREAIKTGKFDAVVFTSSSTVRNLVGIAGKPHQATIVAAIGPATAKTCEEHGLRVDVICGRPNATELIDALAGFAAERRATMIAKGEAVTKPSQRRPGSRRRS